MHDAFHEALEEGAAWDERMLRHAGRSLAWTGGAPAPRDPSPLAEIVLLGRCSLEADDLGSMATSADAPEVSILTTGVRYYQAPASPVHEIRGGQAAYSWVPLDKFAPLEHDDRFANRISGLLKDVGGDRRLDVGRRHHLTNLLFQPLDNARRYGMMPRASGQRRPFAGLVARCVSPGQLSGVAVGHYLSELAAKHHPAPDRFFELIVHDDGPGIAAHFYAAHHDGADLYARNIADEWYYLLKAFERHASSRPRYMEARLNSDLFLPGVGLFAVLSALRALSGFLEVRVGRLRQYRWYFPEDRFSAGDPLLHPPRPPHASALIRGTILRFLIPILGAAR